MTAYPDMMIGMPNSPPQPAGPDPDEYDPVEAATAGFLAAPVRIVDEQFGEGHAAEHEFLTANVVNLLFAEVGRAELRDRP